MPIAKQHKADWERDCMKWRGKVLTGEFCHWCCEWDDLPIDETCPEWHCGCFDMDVPERTQSANKGTV